MKPLKSILLLAAVIFVNMLFADRVLAQGDESAKGPVKTLTINHKIRSENENVVLKVGVHTLGTSYNTKKIIWCDTIGRVLKEVMSIGFHSAYTYVYQYVNDYTAMAYEFDERGLVKGSFKQLTYNTDGKLELVKRYSDGIVQGGDSTIYDSHGRKIIQFRMNNKSKEWEFNRTFEYDSLGRVSKMRSFEETYTVEYHKNGSYTEYHTNKRGETYKRKITVNKLGQIIKITSPLEQKKFSKFDKYGNWLHCEWLQITKSNLGNLNTTIEREIEYCE